MKYNHEHECGCGGEHHHHDHECNCGNEHHHEHECECNCDDDACDCGCEDDEEEDEEDDEDDDQELSFDCPNCGEKLEFDLDDLDCEGDCEGCTGCDLDIEPQDRYDQQTFWYSAKAAEGGLTGCYNALLENGIYGRAAVYWEDDATPNGYNFSNDDSWTTIANGAQTATSGGIIANRWSHAYKGIGRCNTLLDNIDLNRELDKSVIEEY